ncbi:MAG: T9SS type A sorting domain-containing protein [Bacteroidia bacterium]|nr:T9SS type A sorting domain-containing protein [Bacteroidia bacterium]
MKKFITLVFSLSSFLMLAQTYNSPESIEFDYANNRWFIANNGGNNILTRNSNNGTLAVFVATGFSGGGPHGLEIVGDTLYACAGNSLRAYNINTAALVFNINLAATFLNGITHDNVGNLYITDYSGNKIYRFNTNTRQFNTFVSSGISSPNGIIFDQPNNRCVFVQWTGAIRAVSLVDSTVTTLVASSGLSSIDGITKDGSGNYYLSSWSPTRITRYSNTFTSPTAVVTTGLSSPADIFYNVLTDTLGVPNSGSGNNTTYHYFGSPTAIAESNLENEFNISVFPNPIKKSATVTFVLPSDQKVSVKLFDEKGALVKVVSEEKQYKGQNTLFVSKENLSAGNYYLSFMFENNKQQIQKLIIAE